VIVLLLFCPYCELEAEETEFSSGGQAHIKRESVGSSDVTFEKYLFAKKNPKGVHFERWRHSNGCGKWFHAARSTLTLEVYGTYKAQTFEPPQALQNKIRKKISNWKWELS